MGLGSKILGFVSAPFVGERYDGNGYNGKHYSAACDKDEEFTFHTGPAVPDTMVPVQRINSVIGDSLANRSQGTYTQIPPRVLSAQTRMKNMAYELPSDTWTHNPEGPAYIVRVPGLPNQVISLQTLNNFTTQPEFLQPLTNLEIEQTVTWINKFRAAIFGQANKQAQAQQDMQTMFPSVFGGDMQTMDG